MIRVPVYDLKELVSIPYSATDFLCDLGQVIHSLSGSISRLQKNNSFSVLHRGVLRSIKLKMVRVQGPYKAGECI